MPIKVFSKEFMHEIGAEAIVKFVIEAAKSLREPAIRVAGDAAVKRTETLKTVAEHRDECLAYIRALPPRERDAILAHLDRHMPYDNRVVERLVMLYKHLGDKKELELRRQTFLVLGHMTPAQFDNFIEHLTNDFIQQYARLFWEVFNRWADQAARGVQSHADHMEDSVAAHPGRIFVLGFFIDPIGFFREGYNGPDLGPLFTATGTFLASLPGWIWAAIVAVVVIVAALFILI